MLQNKQDKLLFYGMQYICEYCGNQFMSPVTMVIQNIFVKTEKICYGRIIVLQTSYIELQSIIDMLVKARLLNVTRISSSQSENSLPL